MNYNVKEILKKGLIVSCQALEDEPLHSSFIMSRMAVAAKQGGAIAIRSNSKEDIKEIKNAVDLPVIGIVKREFDDSEIYITPTIKEVEEVCEGGADIVAIDATLRKRPGNILLDQLIHEIRSKFPKLFIMADCSNFDEGVNADKLGFDLIATTLSGYTPYTKGCSLPNIELIKKLSETVSAPVIAEGGIWTVEDANTAYNSGAYSIVIGSAITRPQLITRRFFEAIS
ncbi:MAG TPA: N-acetylmannosamine-6-phosphate 2-epimerase [Victivallales bacterium]|nr:N-acetylmannosamine-6-phosphate 2-epimerase [Victivallales bacterium]